MKVYLKTFMDHQCKPQVDKYGRLRLQFDEGDMNEWLQVPAVIDGFSRCPKRGRLTGRTHGTQISLAMRYVQHSTVHKRQAVNKFEPFIVEQVSKNSTLHCMIFPPFVYSDWTSFSKFRPAVICTRLYPLTNIKISDRR
jgi:hypothetical protein